MATAAKSLPRRSTARRTVRRAAGRQHLSDTRYFVQCAYRLAMAIITLIAMIVITH